MKKSADEIKREIAEKGIEEGMKRGMEKGMEKGLEKGMKKGMEKGREDERLKLILSMYSAMNEDDPTMSRDSIINNISRLSRLPQSDIGNILKSANL